MKMSFWSTITFLLMTLFLVPSWGEKKPEVPLSTVNFVVLRDENGKPVRNAAVVVHAVDDDGKQERGGIELKTDPDGKAQYDGIPYGKMRIQVLAHGFQTYGDDFNIAKPSVDITIKLKRPAQQYSIYEQHQSDNKDQKPQ
ncbi:MAG TPA: carboxypeptidase-like regulatory domain-containing protein [Terriglobales bacterium]|nr:carboxypeptidase-like regulatory domain-containing protein [Terriglobales bacterium]